MLHVLLLVLQLCLNIAASTDFQDCYNRLRNGEFGLDSAVDSNGNKVTDLAQAAGLTYEACKIDCGPGSEAFVWRNFSNQFTTWLLPWLALISQLPYGANDALSNFETMVLTVGSPMLAGYSLALAVTSNRWMIKRFRRSTHQGCFHAARILCSLQQVPVDIKKIEGYMLPSLIVIEENGDWWRKLDEALDYPSPRWTLAAIVSMSYVALAYAFTWVDTLTGELTAQLFDNGQCISSIWLSLLPIVICNLQLSPKYDPKPIIKAVEAAKNPYFIITEADGLEQTTSSRAEVIFDRDEKDDDQICPTPICFYARIFSWIQTARTITDAFDAVSHHKYASQQGNNGVSMRMRSEVIRNFQLDDNRSHFYDIFRICMISALLALLLQWGTTGAAIMAIYLTPTRGFGCRSAAFLLYGVLSTIVWLLLVISSVLAHSFRASGKSRKVIGALATCFRQTAKTIAAINAAWILTSSMFQFSSIFDNCYCNAGVLGLGSKAYAVLTITPDDQKLTKAYWTAGMIMASGTALVFISAINLLLKRPERGVLI